MAAYYNEIEPFATAWLRELIARDLIAPGDVDERSIEVVNAGDLAGYTQCHFFAGIGVWSYALRRAGWADDSPVWTGSCPCQPFSASGKGEGFDDRRHLWPAWYRLIRECRPDVCFGEQVADPAGLAWFDVVSADLEAAGYAIGAADTCAASVGAPHIRQRLYFVGHSEGNGRRASAERSASAEATREGERCVGTDIASIVGDPARDGRKQGIANGCGGAEGVRAEGTPGRTAEPSIAGCVAVANGGNASAEGLQRGGEHRQRTEDRRAGFWDACDWFPCTDGKARPVEPGSFPLVTGAPARLGRLRGYGNAINAEQAVTFIEAYCEVRGIP